MHVANYLVKYTNTFVERLVLEVSLDCYIMVLTSEMPGMKLSVSRGPCLVTSNSLKFVMSVKDREQNTVFARYLPGIPDQIFSRISARHKMRLRSDSAPKISLCVPGRRSADTRLFAHEYGIVKPESPVDCCVDADVRSDRMASRVIRSARLTRRATFTWSLSSRICLSVVWLVSFPKF